MFLSNRKNESCRDNFLVVVTFEKQKNSFTQEKSNRIVTQVFSVCK